MVSWRAIWRWWGQTSTTFGICWINQVSYYFFTFGTFFRYQKFIYMIADLHRISRIWVIFQLFVYSMSSSTSIIMTDVIFWGERFTIYWFLSWRIWISRQMMMMIVVIKMIQRFIGFGMILDHVKITRGFHITKSSTRTSASKMKIVWAGLAQFARMVFWTETAVSFSVLVKSTTPTTRTAQCWRRGGGRRG